MTQGLKPRPHFHILGVTSRGDTVLQGIVDTEEEAKRIKAISPVKTIATSLCYSPTCPRR